MNEANIWNSRCPVCGSPIDDDMPLVEFAHVSEGHHHQDEGERGIRLCSQDCAVIAEKSPEKYRVAAAANKVVGNAP